MTQISGGGVRSTPSHRVRMAAGRRGRANSAFVFAVVGDRHVAGVKTALLFLKKFSRAEIFVIRSRSQSRIQHDQVMTVQLPDALDDRQATIFLKTAIAGHVRGLAKCFCYLDSDVIAVHDEVDSIFDKRSGAINFALDHVNIDQFSPWAVNCGCSGGSCRHLRDAIANTFDVGVASGDWRLWNGGVFLFDENSEEFLAAWHKMTLAVFDDPYWKTRDQGTLAATVWKLGYQEQRPLDSEFNLVVDRMWGIPQQRRDRATISDFQCRRDYSLTGEDNLMAPRLIHFINGGVGQKGWKNWDDVHALIRRSRWQRRPEN